ncbi:MAG: ribonuclease II [Candidatus Cloacimonetes bacterium HGW-Cloacimonetes-3]|jgi:exoribonuclease-2|nr:MAG: ribonuclease II [Candidatus Cloacimonetes bacterium HGW-Cloacimonetes-3]
MIDIHNKGHRARLRQIAHRVMLERGLLTDFTATELAELDTISFPAIMNNSAARDQRELIWCSIDNSDSRDLDQLTYAEAIGNGDVKIYVAIADVDAVVEAKSELDKHAHHNTCTVYTAAALFPMLPEKLSADLTSLGFHAERMAVIVEMLIAPDGSIKSSLLYRAMVKNKAKLSYHKLAEWLEGRASVPNSVSQVKGLEANLRLQDKVAQKMKELRHEHGALEFETIHASPVFENEILKDLVQDRSNRAKDIVADFMIAANGAVARYLNSQKYPSLRRVVRTPQRWDRIVELAEEHGTTLPAEPNAKALNQFLMAAKTADPLRFPDVSLSVIKLLGGGDYTIELPGDNAEGHFGLAVKDYTHSTAPNRRYPDLITHRLVKAALSGQPVPYNNAELEELARHCTLTENTVKKVERQVDKSAAALLLQSRIGDVFDGIVTGAAGKGTWVRLLHLPVEGRLISGHEGMDVGHKLRVQLVSTDVERGFIDLRKAE